MTDRGTRVGIIDTGAWGVTTCDDKIEAMPEPDARRMVATCDTPGYPVCSLVRWVDGRWVGVS